MPRCMSISSVTIRLTITSARGAAKLGANLDSLPLRGADSLNTHTNLIIMNNYEGLTQQQFNEIQAAYYMQQMELNQQRHEFTTMVQNKVAAKLIVNSLSRLFG